MSADKNKSLARRVNLLARMARVGMMYGSGPVGGGIGIHCEGGMALRDPDLQRLARDGHVNIVRYAYSKVWARDLRNPADLRRSAARLTEKGLAFLRQNLRLVEGQYVDHRLIEFPNKRRHGRIVSDRDMQGTNWYRKHPSPYKPEPIYYERREEFHLDAL